MCFPVDLFDLRFCFRVFIYHLSKLQLCKVARTIMPFVVVTNDKDIYKVEIVAIAADCYIQS